MTAVPEPDPPPRADVEAAEVGFNLSGRATAVAIGQALVKLPQLVLAVVLVRFLTDAEWNSLSFALTVYATGTGLGGLNIHQSVFFFFGRVERDERRGLALQTTLMLACTGTVASAVILSLAFGLRDSTIDIAQHLPLLGLVVLLEVPTIATPDLLLAAERPRAAALFSAGAAVLRALALLVPVLVGHGLTGVLYALLAYALLRLALHAIVIATATTGRFRLPRSPGTRLRDQIHYTLPLALTLASGLINRMLDKWLVAGFDPQHFGSYFLAAQELPLIPVLAGAMGAVAATRYVWHFKHGRPDRAHALFVAAAARVTLLVLPATLAVIACAPELFAVAFTTDHLVAIVPFQIFSVILVHRIAEYGIILRAAGDTRGLWFASLSLLGSNAVLSLPLVAILGMTGATLGTLMANGIAWIYILRRIARVLGVPFSEVLPWRLYAYTLALATAVGGLVYAIGPLLPLETAPRLLAKAGIFLVVYAPASLALGLRRRLVPVPLDEVAFVKQAR